MNIDLKDGFCVSCDRESGVLYQSCPYCGESVWHPLWRRLIRGYTLFVLPLALLAAIMLNLSRFKPLWELCAGGSWIGQSVIVISMGLLLLPLRDKKLILTSSRGHVMWLLNSLAASVLLLLCALTAVLVLRFTVIPGGVIWLCAAIALSGALLIPLVLNSGWWRVVLAALIVMGLMFV